MLKSLFAFGRKEFMNTKVSDEKRKGSAKWELIFSWFFETTKEHFDLIRRTVPTYCKLVRISLPKFNVTHVRSS